MLAQFCDAFAAAVLANPDLGTTEIAASAFLMVFRSF
jgi:hypothetical protein